MNCCPNCFHDSEIIGFILTNSTQTGNCDFCEQENIKILDPRELEEAFQPIVSLLVPPGELGIELIHGKAVYDILLSHWKIFKLPNAGKQKVLIDTILSNTRVTSPYIFDSPVLIKPLYSNSIQVNHHELKWEKLAEEIKTKNRYFLEETIDLTLLKDLLSFLSRTYSAGKIFYRARVSTIDGYAIDQMGKPPGDRATSGRANPVGIAYLYVSTALETTLYESRSSYLDYISIGEFKLIEPLKIISLRDVYSSVSPFLLGENLETFTAYQKYLARLGQELSKPVRRFDKELDYLPSQYLCEYVKYLGYDAIEYSSSLHEGGINLAIFNDSKLKCRKASVYEIDSVSLRYKAIVK